MSSSNKFVIEKQLVVKEIEVVDLTHLDDETLDESGKNDTKYEEMSESDETIQNNKDGNTTIVLQQMYRWKDVPFPWEIQRMMVSRVQRKFSDEFLSLGFKKGAKDEIFKGKMSDIHSMLMMVTSSYQPSNAINTYKEHDDFLLCPFCKSNNWKFKGYVFSFFNFDALLSVKH